VCVVVILGNAYLTMFFSCVVVVILGNAYLTMFFSCVVAVILGNAYLTMFFSCGQNSAVLRQCLSAYQQAVRTFLDCFVLCTISHSRILGLICCPGDVKGNLWRLLECCVTMPDARSDTKHSTHVHTGGLFNGHCPETGLAVCLLEPDG